jgi:glycosyltransferase involved in cell wall biosynthesis
MNPKVSVLVPVYKVSAYIERCAESLFNQTFKELEYIFVNDATPDDSIDKLKVIMELYPERKKQVKIIRHPSNKGLAVTRNTAINASTGNYIAVVDSDDYIESEMIETLYNKAINEQADIVVSDYFMEYKDKTAIITDYVDADRNENFKNIIIYDRSCTSLWNKLVKRSLYERPDCRVPEGLNYYEDRHVMTRLYYFATKIVKVDQAFYHYVQFNADAITKSKERMHFENVVQFWDLLDAFLREHNVYELYKPIMSFPKMQGKVRLMIDTNSSALREEYAELFREEEKQCISKFTRGERLMLYLVHYRLFFLAQLFHNYLVLTNK